MVADSCKEETFKGKQLHEIQTEDMIFLGLSFFMSKIRLITYRNYCISFLSLEYFQCFLHLFASFQSS